MRTLSRCLAFVLATAAGLSTAAAGPDKWIDGVVSYKFAGLDPHFANPADACKAGVDELGKHGNHKTFDSVKDGTSSTSMTCVLKESDGTVFEQTNVINKLLECPATTTARSTDNSGEFSKIRCHCDDKKKGCPAPAKK
jgi:hypothetical protein